MSFVSHVECTICGARHDAKRLLPVCEKCGQMLAVRYGLERVKASVTKDALRRRAPGMYRFSELTPVDDSEALVTLGGGGAPPRARARGCWPERGAGPPGPSCRGLPRISASGRYGRRTMGRTRPDRSRRAGSAWPS